MNLDFRYIQGFQGVVQGVRVVGPSTGVYDEPVAARRFPYETDHLALVVRLPEPEVQSRKLVLDEPLYIIEGHGPVDLGAAGAEGTEVPAVEDVNLTQRRLRSPREPHL